METNCLKCGLMNSENCNTCESLPDEFSPEAIFDVPHYPGYEKPYQVTGEAWIINETIETCEK